MNDESSSVGQTSKSVEPVTTALANVSISETGDDTAPASSHRGPNGPMANGVAESRRQAQTVPIASPAFLLTALHFTELCLINLGAPDVAATQSASEPSSSAQASLQVLCSALARLAISTEQECLEVRSSSTALLDIAQTLAAGLEPS